MAFVKGKRKRKIGLKLVDEKPKTVKPEHKVKIAEVKEEVKIVNEESKPAVKKVDLRYGSEEECEKLGICIAKGCVNKAEIQSYCRVCAACLFLR